MRIEWTIYGRYMYLYMQMNVEQLCNNRFTCVAKATTTTPTTTSFQVECQWVRGTDSRYQRAENKTTYIHVNTNSAHKNRPTTVSTLRKITASLHHCNSQSFTSLVPHDILHLEFSKIQTRCMICGALITKSAEQSALVGGCVM